MNMNEETLDGGLETLPANDPYARYRKKNAKLLGRMVVDLLDDGNPPKVTFYGNFSRRALSLTFRKAESILTRCMVLKNTMKEKPDDSE